MMKKHKDEMGKDIDAACQRKTTIGGQALIEGLMMIGPEKKAMAVRRPDGTITVEQLPVSQFSGLANWPFFRGSIRLFRQLVSGTKALLRSAEMADDTLSIQDTPSGGPSAGPSAPDDGLAAKGPADIPGLDTPAMPAEPSADDTARPDDSPDAPDGSRPASWTSRAGQAIDRYLSAHTSLMLYGSAVLGILFSVGLFILLPNLLASLIRQWTGLASTTGRGSTIILNLVEGLIRITLFVAYLALANRMKDIRRVWMYHGAEHKAIACYEAQQPMTVAHVRTFSRFHPRCGTAFLFLVILVSIIVFSLVGWWGRWINLLIRFALVPLVAGIAYEIIRLAGRYDNWLTRAISKPGLMLQRLTTAEPDDAILEVAIAALEAVRPVKADSDRW